MTVEAPQLTTDKVRNSLQRLINYGSNLIYSNNGNFKDRVSHFVNFCKTNEVLAQIYNEIIIVGDENDYDTWWNEVEETSSLEFPSEPDKRIYILFSLLNWVNKHEEPNNYALNISHKFSLNSLNHIDHYIKAFNKTITAPLVQELRYKLEDILNSIPNNDKGIVSPSFLKLNVTAQNFIVQNAQGNNNSQIAKIDSSSELESEFSKLEQLIKEHLPSDVHNDNLDLVETAKDLALANKPSKAKSLLIALKNVLAASPAIAKGAESVAKGVESVAASIEHINRILDHLG